MSDVFAIPDGDSFDGWSFDPGCVSDPALHEQLSELRMHPRDVTGDLVNLLLDAKHTIDTKSDDCRTVLAHALSRTLTLHGAATHIASCGPWELLVVNFDVVDQLSQTFLQFMAPRVGQATKADHARFRSVLEGAYRYVDIMLAPYLQLAGPGAIVRLTSDHGYFTGPLRKRPPELRVGNAHAAHKGLRIFMRQRPGLADRPVDHGCVHDRYRADDSGLARDCGAAGWVRRGAHRRSSKAASSMRTVSGHGGPAKRSRRLERNGDSEDHGTSASSQHFGHFTRRQRSGGRGGKLRSPLQDRAESTHGGPSFFAACVASRDPRDLFGACGCNLLMAKCHVALARCDQAKAALDIVRALGRDAPQVDLLLGRTAFAADDRGTAKMQFDKAAQGAGKTMQGAHILADVGCSHLRMGLFNAASEVFERALKIDGASARALNGLGTISLKAQDHHQALAYLQASLGTLDNQPRTHMMLGYAFLGLGLLRKARSAFDVALPMDPALDSARVGRKKADELEAHCALYALNAEMAE
ncbi:tetratricopeptide repeat protein [Roseobacter sp. WL0113]|uniref:Tetratricopeptide repeat protein n=2 Tax=Roseobacter sinensis TaxID=2931391 RepID=A0ABT3BIN2_9RHOB|nr:tetratricopeptide repeat protein [Roseobacter sp. WL0113]MCV3273435.1 tetratricopeptide repeat protein [Roseobacter sp. WL0113]